MQDNLSFSFWNINICTQTYVEERMEENMLEVLLGCGITSFFYSLMLYFSKLFYEECLLFILSLINTNMSQNPTRES